MGGIEKYLEFTVETGEEFQGGWLPTLDTSIRVGQDNQIMFKFFKKEVSSKRTVQKLSAMGENMKMSITANDLVRRLLNTSEQEGADVRSKVVDDYAQELTNSGYGIDQVRKIIINGIKGYEGRKRKRAAEGRSLRSTAAGSRGSRIRKKLTNKTSWYKSRHGKKSNMDMYGAGNKGSSKNIAGRKEQQQVEYKTTLFVENTHEEQLAKNMRELMKRLAPSLGFGVKVVERTGDTLRSRFPLTNLWEGAKCGRKECRTCEQECEELPNCTRASVVYENICKECNEGAGNKGELKKVKEGAPSLYVGETSRSLFERTKEHWGAWESKSDKSHILKHQLMVHKEQEPRFVMKAVKYYRSALTRQIGEAVRIRRRGGAGMILNSKSDAKSPA